MTYEKSGANVCIAIVFVRQIIAESANVTNAIVVDEIRQYRWKQPKRYEPKMLYHIIQTVWYKLYHVIQ